MKRDRPNGARALVAMLVVILGLAVPAAASAQTTKRVTVLEEACPPSIQTPSQYDPGHLPDPCIAAARTGTVDPPPAGHTYDPEPLEFDLRLSVTGIDGDHAFADADLVPNVYCAPGGTTCQYGQSYRWEIESGPVVVHVDTVPPGYRFGWATGVADVETVDVHPTVDPAGRTISFDLDDWAGGVTISVAQFTRAAPRATTPPTSTEATASPPPTQGGFGIGLIALGSVCIAAAVLLSRRRAAWLR